MKTCECVCMYRGRRAHRHEAGENRRARRADLPRGERLRRLARHLPHREEAADRQEPPLGRMLLLDFRLSTFDRSTLLYCY